MLTPLRHIDDAGAASVVQPDGKIVVVGYSRSDTDADVAVVRYLPDGALDTSFGENGQVITSMSAHTDEAHAVTMQGDKLLVAGVSFDGKSFDPFIIRYDRSGSIDKTFATDGIWTGTWDGDDEIHDIAVHGSNIYLAGSTSTNGTADFAAIRLTADGQIDQTFGTAGRAVVPIGISTDIARGMAIYENGHVVLVGYSALGHYNDVAIAQLTPEGSLDENFDGDGLIAMSFGTGNDYGIDVAIDRGDRIIIGVQSDIGTSGVSQPVIVRLTSTGAFDPIFGTNGTMTLDQQDRYNQIRAIAVQDDGKIVIGGSEYGLGFSVAAATRLDSTGSVDTTFGFDGFTRAVFESQNAMIQSIAIQPDGRIVLAGWAYSGSSREIAVARLRGTDSETGNNSNSSNSQRLYLDASHAIASFSGTTGFQFRANTAITIAELGQYDGGMDGLAQDGVVAIWNTNGAVVASVNVPAGPDTPLIGEFRYQSLPEPIVLSANETFIVGAYTASDDTAIVPVGPPFPLQGQISQLAGRYVSSDGPVFPSQSSAAIITYGANLRLAPTVDSILLASREEPDKTSIEFVVVFSQPVAGVDPHDFLPVISGDLVGVAVDSVRGNGSTYVVSVRTGSGIGGIRLKVEDDDSIASEGIPLGGKGKQNGQSLSRAEYQVRTGAAPSPPFLSRQDEVLLARRLDAKPDGYCTALDALVIINDLNDNGSRPLPVAIARHDTNRDGHVSPQDVLGVINFINDNGFRKWPEYTPRAVVDSGLLTVDGTDDRERVSVSLNDGAIEVTVAMTEGESEWYSYVDTHDFDASAVHLIVFNGFDGDDTFLNDSPLRTIALGGRGDDLLIGGSEADSLLGNEGQDRILAREGDDLLFGGGGDDTLRGGVGSDYFGCELGSDDVDGEDGADVAEACSGANRLSSTEYGDVGDSNQASRLEIVAFEQVVFRPGVTEPRVVEVRMNGSVGETQLSVSTEVVEGGKELPAMVEVAENLIRLTPTGRGGGKMTLAVTVETLGAKDLSYLEIFFNEQLPAIPSQAQLGYAYADGIPLITEDGLLIDRYRPGVPFVFLVEGRDGCCTSHMTGVIDWLRQEGYRYHFSDWNDLWGGDAETLVANRVYNMRTGTNEGSPGGVNPVPFRDTAFVDDLSFVVNSIPETTPVILIGHSYGADSVVKAAQKISRRISLLGLLDAVQGDGRRSTQPVPENVDYLFNRWQTVSPFPWNFILTETSPLVTKSFVNDQTEQSILKTPEGDVLGFQACSAFDYGAWWVQRLGYCKSKVADAGEVVGNILGGALGVGACIATLFKTCKSDVSSSTAVGGVIGRVVGGALASAKRPAFLLHEDVPRDAFIQHELIEAIKNILSPKGVIRISDRPSEASVWFIEEVGPGESIIRNGNTGLLLDWSYSNVGLTRSLKTGLSESQKWEVAVWPAQESVVGRLVSIRAKGLQRAYLGVGYSEDRGRVSVLLDEIESLWRVSLVAGTGTEMLLGNYFLGP